MSTIQRALVAIYIPASIVFLLMDWIYPDHLLVRIFKFSSIATLFIFSLFIEKRYYEQKVMVIALLFAVFGDFFLGFGGRLEIKDIVTPLGMGSFFISYSLLSYAFNKKSTYKKKEILAAIPIMIGFIYLIITLIPYIQDKMVYGSILFGLMLSYMSWNAISTIFRDYYSTKASRYIAIAGILIFISDVAVANSLFHPAFSFTFVPWLENIIWTTFVPAWTIIVMTITEKKLYKSTRKIS